MSYLDVEPGDWSKLPNASEDEFVNKIYENPVRWSDHFDQFVEKLTGLKSFRFGCRSRLGKGRNRARAASQMGFTKASGLCEPNFEGRAELEVELSPFRYAYLITGIGSSSWILNPIVNSPNQPSHDPSDLNDLIAGDMKPHLGLEVRRLDEQSLEKLLMAIHVRNQS